MLKRINFPLIGKASSSNEKYCFFLDFSFINSGKTRYPKLKSFHQADNSSRKDFIRFPVSISLPETSDICALFTQLTWVV
jgi:hypothetical protein